MPAPNRALFHLISQVDVTCESHYNPIRKSFSPRKVVVPATFAVTWPDGTPCTLVEMYLISKFRRGVSVQEDGGTLRATVSKLSHLLRHCWSKRDFWELDDDNIDTLVESLMAEMKPKAPRVRVRDNNTVRNIIACTVEFLLWLQNNIMVGISLIGIGPEFRIHLVERKVLDSRRNRHIVQLVYHRLPPPDTKEPKRPISNDKRNALWEAVSNMSGVRIVLPQWAHRNNHGPSVIIAYLKARRELLLELLEATGARPGELARLCVSINEECYKSQELVLVTLKRRRNAERKIKLQAGVAMRLTVFIRRHRAALLQAIEEGGGTATPQDRVFLGIKGEPLSARTMVSEFSRISEAAGLSKYQCCMSMFRHRFITKQVAIHLGIYLGQEKRTREMMTDADYRTILKKVATITGHGKETSLLHYLDLAWDELGTGNQVDAAIAIDASLESASTQITSLIGEMKHSGRSSGELLKTVGDILTGVQHELRTAMAKQNTRPQRRPSND